MLRTRAKGPSGPTTAAEAERRGKLRAGVLTVMLANGRCRRPQNFPISAQIYGCRVVGDRDALLPTYPPSSVGSGRDAPYDDVLSTRSGRVDGVFITRLPPRRSLTLLALNWGRGWAVRPWLVLRWRDGLWRMIRWRGRRERISNETTDSKATSFLLLT